MVADDDRFMRSYNWCDSRCDRCPCASTCPLFERVIENPGELELPERHPDEARLCDLAVELYVRVDTAVGAQSELVPAHANDLRLDALMLAAKTARVAGLVDPGADEDSVAMAEPTLLLIDHLRERFVYMLWRVQHAINYDAVVRIRHALFELFRQLDPLIARVSDDARAQLDEIVERQAAPSPFCVVGDDEGSAPKSELEHARPSSWLWCLHCHRFFQHRRLRVDWLGNRQQCAFCDAAGLDVDIFRWDAFRGESWPATANELRHGLIAR
jgi:hypothetical protein